MTLLKDQYQDILTNSLANRPKFSNLKRAMYKGQSQGFLLVEITDPCARIIEYIKKKNKGVAI